MENYQCSQAAIGQLCIVSYRWLDNSYQFSCQWWLVSSNRQHGWEPFLWATADTWFSSPDSRETCRMHFSWDLVKVCTTASVPLSFDNDLFLPHRTFFRSHTVPSIPNLSGYLVIDTWRWRVSNSVRHRLRPSFMFLYSNKKIKKKLYNPLPLLKGKVSSHLVNYLSLLATELKIKEKRMATSTNHDQSADFVAFLLPAAAIHVVCTRAIPRLCRHVHSKQTETRVYTATLSYTALYFYDKGNVHIFPFHHTPS